MNKLLLTISFGILLIVSSGAYAGVERLTTFISKANIQRALESTRQAAITNTVSNVCPVSPFTHVPDVETFGIDEIGPDSILQEQLKMG